MIRNATYLGSQKTIVITVLIVTISLATLGFIAYHKVLNSNQLLLQEFSNLQSRVDNQLQEQSRIYDLKLNYQRRRGNSIVAELTNLKTNLLPDPDQNRLIANIAKYNQHLDKELKKLSDSINKKLNQSAPYNHPDLNEQNTTTLATLTKEEKLTEQKTAKMLAKIDGEFNQLSLDAQQIRVYDSQILDAINRYNTTSNKQLQAESIDCRESMCKISINNLNYEDMEFIEQEIIIGVSNITDSYTLTQNIETNPGGLINALYYLNVD